MRAVTYDLAETIPRTIFPQGVRTGPAFEPEGAAAIACFGLNAGRVTAARAV